MRFQWPLWVCFFFFFSGRSPRNSPFKFLLPPTCLNCFIFILCDTFYLYAYVKSYDYCNNGSFWYYKTVLEQVEVSCVCSAVDVAHLDIFVSCSVYEDEIIERILAFN